MKRVFRRCPLLFLILVTCVLFGGVSVRGEQDLYRDIPAVAGYEPFCAPMFKGIHEGIYPWSRTDFGPVKGDCKAGMLKTVAVSARLDYGIERAGTVSGSEVPGTDSVSGNAAVRPHSLSENAAARPNSPLGNDAGSSGSHAGNAAVGPDNALGSAEEAPAFQRVGEDYFDDALFIGDSRTVGLFEYGRIEDRARFYAQTSLMIYEVMENPKAIVRTDDGRGSITVEEALSENQFGKIYIMLGLNEMGFGTPESFGKAYGAVLGRIRELQPDAVIYIQSIMHVADEKNRTDPVYNNTNIDLRNQPLKQLADNRNIFYLDVNEVLCDETGCLNSDWTFDQVHLKAAYYQVWKDFLLEHAIVRQ